MHFPGFIYYVYSHNVLLVEKILDYWNFTADVTLSTDKLPELTKIWSLKEFTEFLADISRIKMVKNNQTKKEIERKFLVKKIPSNLNEYPHFYIKQGYFYAGKDMRIRTFVIKNQDVHPVFCIKSEGTICRDETEISLTQYQFQELWKHINELKIEKTRYLIPYKHHIIELDIYHKKLKGLITAEIEFETIKESEEFIPPIYLGQDVSKDARFKNKNLANRCLF